MMTRFKWNKRKSLATIIICAIILAASFMYWPKSQVAEAAIIDPHPGLVGWWRFDEGTGNVAKDSSGFGNNGIIYGAIWVDGKYGKALSFDGTNDYVQIPISSSLKLPLWTISAWVETNVVDSAYHEIIRKDGAIGANYLIDLDSANVWDSAFYDGVQWRTASSGITPTIGMFYYVLATWDGTNLKIYVDGILKSSVNYAGSTPDQADTIVNIGSANGYRFFNGIIDEVRIYNRALSATEIQEIFQKRPDFSSKLLAKVPKGTTQVIVTVSWQGIGTINAIMESPSKIYTESNVSSFYQKNVYSITGNTSDMLNIKRLSVLVNALSSDENWYIVLTFDNVEDYRIIVEAQK